MTIVLPLNGQSRLTGNWQYGSQAWVCLTSRLGKAAAETAVALRPRAMMELAYMVKS